MPKHHQKALYHYYTKYLAKLIYPPPKYIVYQYIIFIVQIFHIANSIILKKLQQKYNIQHKNHHITQTFNKKTIPCTETPPQKRVTQQKLTPTCTAVSRNGSKTIIPILHETAPPLKNSCQPVKTCSKKLKHPPHTPTPKTTNPSDHQITEVP